ncbi:MAG: arsenate reductase family protein [Lachnospiraceae bacterium]|nr:arsenate reductase family protein [Lachnospiraceae bacterium]
MNTFICYDKCGTCKKAKKWLDAHGIAYEVRPIKEENPSQDELAEWIKKSGRPVRKFFNTSGQLYRSMQLKDRLKEMSEEEMIGLLASDGMLVKRPVFLSGENVLVGFKEEEWEAAIL